MIYKGPGEAETRREKNFVSRKLFYMASGAALAHTPNSNLEPTYGRSSQPGLATVMSLSTRRDGVLWPEGAIQEMTPRQRRACHARDRSNARTEGGRVGAASAHAEREHAIEQCSYERFGRRLARQV